MDPAAGMTALLAPIVIVLLAPSFVIIPMSFSTSLALSWPPEGFTLEWYGKLFGSAEWLSSAVNSLGDSFGGDGIALVLGVPAGFAFGLRDWPAKQFALAVS